MMGMYESKGQPESSSPAEGEAQSFPYHRNDAFVRGSNGKATTEETLIVEEDYENSQEFHNTVRENIIFLLFFLTLLVLASMLVDVLSPMRSRKRSARNGDASNAKAGGDANNGQHQAPDDGEDESVVKRICSWVCTFSLSTSIGATLLLPISIVSNEILLLYPTNAYLEWLNGMLIQGLWSLVFLFSNIALFVLLPFAHLFIEAEGFSGKKEGLVAKLQETVVVLTLLSFTVWGISVIANNLIVTRGPNVLFHFNQLPFIYSFISFGGVLLLTLCTPLGLWSLFTVLSANFVFVPEFLRNLEEEHTCAVLEYENLKAQQQRAKSGKQFNPAILVKRKRHSSSNTSSNAVVNIELAIEDVKRTIAQLDSLRTTPPWKRNLLYPSVFLTVLSVTGLTVFIVMINAVKIVVGFRDLSLELVAKETLPLGGSSLSFLGPSGAVFEIILVVYLMTSSLIGIYSLPVFKSITPAVNRTPTSHLISNCAVAVVLSSALPVFMRILGLTNFDLLGTYAGKIDWIENTQIVVCVNLLFTGLTCVILINKVTRKISHEIISRIRHFFYKD